MKVVFLPVFLGFLSIASFAQAQTVAKQPDFSLENLDRAAAFVKVKTVVQGEHCSGVFEYFALQSRSGKLHFENGEESLTVEAAPYQLVKSSPHLLSCHLTFRFQGDQIKTVARSHEAITVHSTISAPQNYNRKILSLALNQVYEIGGRVARLRHFDQMTRKAVVQWLDSNCTAGEIDFSQLKTAENTHFSAEDDCLTSVKNK